MEIFKNAFIWLLYTLSLQGTERSEGIKYASCRAALIPSTPGEFLLQARFTRRKFYAFWLRGLKEKEISSFSRQTKKALLMSTLIETQKMKRLSRFEACSSL